MHSVPAHHHHHVPLVSLKCITFALEQREFHLFDIDSAELFLKLEDVAASLHLDASSSVWLYIEVNGVIAHKVDLHDLLHRQATHFVKVNLKDIMQSDMIMNKMQIVDEDSSLVKPARLLRVKLLINSNHYLDDKHVDVHAVFADVDQRIALHVKFGEMNDFSLNEESFGGVSTPRKQRAVGHLRQAKTGHYKHQPGKIYRECADLRRVGYTKSNYSCCRETISFSMEQLGWSHWILSPKVIEYKYCRGGCSCKYSANFRIFF